MANKREGRGRIAWSAKEREKLFALKAQGLNWADISKQLGRSPSGCKGHYLATRWGTGLKQDRVKEAHGKETIANTPRPNGPPSAIIYARPLSLTLMRDFAMAGACDSGMGRW